MSNYRVNPQIRFNFEELSVDNFAGGGGASTGIEEALGRAVDLAINHDEGAIAMHEVNHPGTRHLCESVWSVNPREVCEGRPVGLAWFSPDCKHFSKAKGGKPVEKKIRGLAWVVMRWAATVRPRVIFLENVEEFVTWGPLVTDEQGRCYPCPKNKGRTFNSFVNALRHHGYEVDYRELRACDYGVPTIRKRLFLIARCDRHPIVWPVPTHGDLKSHAVKVGLLKPWRTAADCIDWDIPCPSIFDRKKPLAEATMRRIAKGIMRYVINNPEPFIVPLTHHGERSNHDINEPFRTITGANRGEMALITPYLTEHANASNQRNMPADSPLRTQCAQVKGGHFALVSAFLAKHYGGVVGHEVDKPAGTVTTSDHHSLVTASLVRNFGKSAGVAIDSPHCAITSKSKDSLVTAHLVRQLGQSVGSTPAEPVGTVMPGGLGKTGLITSHLLKLRGTSRDGQPVTEPLHTVSAQGQHFGEVRAFLLKYYGSDQDPNLREPLHTVTTKERFGLVTVRGEEYQIVDIGMRMLTPRELFRAQGFPEDYVIDRDAHGQPITKTAQVARCGNSVCPPLAAMLVRANVVEQAQERRVA
jgi:DNA (cytosine-5)-methyltransferase 1